MYISAQLQQVGRSVNGTQVSGTVLIALTDANGAPVNGNGIVILYTEVLNGVSSNHEVTIPGQFGQIYTGILSDSATGFDVYFYITGQREPVTPPDPTPQPGICDLTIQNIIIQKESVFGAHDAIITVDARSSYGGIQYSLDNVTFVSYNYFANLSSISGTVYVKDSNNCTASRAFTIPAPASVLVSDPSVTLQNGNVSRWNAAFNPVNFIYQRKDLEVVSINSYSIINGGSFAQLNVNGDVSSLQTGDAIYVSAGLYQGVYQVLQLGLTPGTIVLNSPYTINGSGFANVNRLKPYYTIITRIKYVDPITGALTTITSTNRPNRTGYVKADISNFMQSILKAKDASDYSQVNYRDDKLSASYQIEYAEAWDGHEPVYIQIANPYYVVYAAKQLGDQYGGNLAAYVPFPVNSAAKWITDFAVPVYNNNLPFDLSFIYGEALAGRQLYYILKQYDINKVQLNVNDVTAFLLNEDSSFLLNQDGSKLVIARQDLFNTPIAEHVGLNRLLINTQFDDIVYYFSVALYYDDESDTQVKITEDQFVRIDKEIQLQSLYLRWIGLTGSWNYYRFYYNQSVGLDVANAVVIKNYVLDWANQDSIEDVVSKAANGKIKLMTEDTSVADIKGLQSIKYSPKVQMLTSANPVKWQTVIVNTSSFDEYDTINGQAPFSITINLPSINIQTQ